MVDNPSQDDSAVTPKGGNHRWLRAERVLSCEYTLLESCVIGRIANAQLNSQQSRRRTDMTKVWEVIADADGYGPDETMVTFTTKELAVEFHRIMTIDREKEDDNQQYNHPYVEGYEWAMGYKVRETDSEPYTSVEKALENFENFDYEENSDA